MEAYIRDVVSKIGVTHDQAKALVHVYFEKMLGIGGVTSLWHNYKKYTGPRNPDFVRLDEQRQREGCADGKTLGECHAQTRGWDATPTNSLWIPQDKVELFHRSLTENRLLAPARGARG